MFTDLCEDASDKVELSVQIMLEMSTYGAGYKKQSQTLIM